MTKDDIIRMAREAGISKPWDQEPVKWETLGRFAALVYTQGHKDGLDDFEAGVLPAAIKAEREACAKVCDELADEAAKEQDFHAIFACESCGSAIRERGQE
jgi:hypothetical protein